MRNLTSTERDEAILASDNVTDLRPKLTEMAKQKAIGFSYRLPVKPEGAA